MARADGHSGLRDVEASLSANATQFHAMGFLGVVERATLVDAKEARNCGIRADLAAVLLRRARKLYTIDTLGADLNKVYALGSSTVDLCLFGWAPFRSPHQAGSFFVMRAKVGMDARRVYSTLVERSSGVICDQRIMLRGRGFLSGRQKTSDLRGKHRHSGGYGEHLRATSGRLLA